MFTGDNLIDDILGHYRRFKDYTEMRKTHLLLRLSVYIRNKKHLRNMCLKWQKVLDSLKRGDQKRDN